jgi:hypothetical protein
VYVSFILGVDICISFFVKIKREHLCHHSKYQGVGFICQAIYTIDGTKANISETDA